MKRRLFSIAVIISLMTASVSMQVNASYFDNKETVNADRQEESNEMKLYAQAATLMDAVSGRILFEKNGEEKRPNASTTKVLTCITILESGADLQEMVEVSAYAAKQPKVHLGMRKGECYRMKDLLYSMMLESHNDSAVALAEAMGRKFLGDSEGAIPSEKAVLAFVDTMNEKAKGIGCEHTYFVTPNGLDAVRTVRDQKNGEIMEKEHMTSSNDLARIMAYCITKSPCRNQFIEITETPYYEFSESGDERHFNCSNKNALLTMREDAVSGKTGFTAAAGYCYVGCVESDGRIYTIALLGAGWPGNKTYKWKDCKKLFDYGEEHFSAVSMEPYYDRLKKDVKISVQGGIGSCLFETPICHGQVDLSLAGQLPDTILLSKDEQIRVQMHCDKELEAPVRKGQKVGNAALYIGDEIWLTFEINAAEEIRQMDKKWFLYQIYRHYFSL